MDGERERGGGMGVGDWNGEMKGGRERGGGMGVGDEEERWREGERWGDGSGRLQWRERKWKREGEM